MKKRLVGLFKCNQKSCVCSQAFPIPSRSNLKDHWIKAHHYGGSLFCHVCGNCTVYPLKCRTFEKCPRLSNECSAKQLDVKKTEDYLERKKMKYKWKGNDDSAAACDGGEGCSVRGEAYSEGGDGDSVMEIYVEYY